MKTRQEQIEHLKNLKDEDIDYSDIPAVEDFSQFRQVPDDILRTFMLMEKQAHNH